MKGAARVIKYPHITEKGTLSMDESNSLHFIVDSRSGKHEIRNEIEGLFNVTVISVRTMMTTNGTKKAIVTLSPEDSAEDIVTRLGVF